MIKRWVAAAAAMVLVSATGMASAAPILSWVGNANGFGGLVPVDHAGEGVDDSFLPNYDGLPDSPPPGPDLVEGSFVQGTDIWTAGGMTVVHANGALTGITGATLRLFSGGWGLGGLAEVFVNGFSVGFLPDGERDNEALLDGEPYNLTVLRDFVLSGEALASLALGNAQVKIVADADDGGVLDYSRLTITTDAGGTSHVPEPTSWALVALALAGLAASRRRQAR